MKKHFSSHSHMISGVFVFLLIGMFAIASVLLVLTGVQVYRGVTVAAQENSDYQLALSYLRGKVRTYDHEDGVSLKDIEGRQTLCLREEIDGETYETYIYYYEGAICEYFSAEEEEFDPDWGERLTEVGALRFEPLTPSLLKVDVTLADGSEHVMHMALRAGQVR